jgi:hypothetical protein
VRKPLILLLVILFALAGKLSAQKVESIHFNLYTDSLKKGFFNYISVDGKFSDGRWQPLDTNQVRLSSNTGFFMGNDLFIDSSYTADTVIVKAVLISNPSITTQTIIYIRKRGFDEPLKTNDEILNDLRSKRMKKRERNA